MRRERSQAERRDLLVNTRPVSIVVVGGPSRVGKTTLCRRLLSRPELSGFDTLCWDAFKYTMAIFILNIACNSYFAIV